LIVHDHPSLRGIDGEEAMAKILKQDKHPTAVFAANDAMAIGCARFLRDRGMKIPDDIAVVGFDDIEMSSHVEPPLTTVRVFKEEIGKLAVLRLVEMIKSKTRTLITTRVPVELIVRESTVGNSMKHP
jgi:LacI family transcriptional regulator